MSHLSSADFSSTLRLNCVLIAAVTDIEIRQRCFSLGKRAVVRPISHSQITASNFTRNIHQEKMKKKTHHRLVYVYMFGEMEPVIFHFKFIIFAHQNGTQSLLY